MLKVSIVVAVYNTEKYLKKCLNSLVNQTLKEIEIICVNDGSTDKSLEILKKYAKNDNRIIVINKENEGQSVARNIAVKQAQGEFIGFVDSDDWVDLNFFEKLYNTAKKNKCDIASAGFKRCKRFRKSTRQKFSNEIIYKDINEKSKIDKIPKHNYIWNKIYNRENFIRINVPFPEGRYFEDMAILIKILYYMGDMVTVPDTYYYYRKTPNSTVATKSKKHSEDFIWAKKEMYDFANKNNIKIPENKNFTKKVYIKILNLTVLKIYYYEDTTKYKLFGFIPFITSITAR